MGELMTESVLTRATVARDAEQQTLTARVACTREKSKLQTVHHHPTTGPSIYKVIIMEHVRGWAAENMRWPNPEEVPDDKTAIISEHTAAWTQVICWVREPKGKVGAGLRMWSADGSQSDDSIVSTAAVCTHRDNWNAVRSHLETRRLEVNDAELWAIGLALQESLRKRDTLHTAGVMNVAIFSYSQAALSQTDHLELRPGYPLARRINWRATTLRKAVVDA